jgi:nucleotide-binding universal stress UspA family protein
MILIAYDGTPSSDHAIAVAGALLRGGRAHVLHVWKPIEPFELLAAVPLTPDAFGDDELRARALAQTGAERARTAGFDADGEAVEAIGSTAAVIEAAIDRLHPELVVLGSRGLTGFGALLKGSVSHEISGHAHAPVLVVPPAPD